MSGLEDKNGGEAKEVKSKRFTDTEDEVEGAKRKKTDAPVERLTVDKDGFTQVFTEGQCIFLGKSGQKVGLGVWWADDHPFNISQRGGGEKLTKNSAEVQAATLAVKVAAREGVKKLLINSHNQQLVNSAGWIPGWKKKGWLTAKGDPVKNKEELVLLDDALSSNKEMEVKWQLNKGEEGNKEAGKLATAGAKLSS